jgi:membrane-associated protease RseP (regulator of RpoE activity)
VRTTAPVLLLLAALAGAADAPAPAPAPVPAPAPGPRSDERPQLGVQIDEVALNVNGGAEAAAKGLPVLHVVPGSTAANMGMQIGDRITAINGTPITKLTDLQTLMPTIKIGDPIAIDVVRGEAKKSLTGTMQKAPNIPNMTEQVRLMRQELEDARRAGGIGKKEPTLAEVLQMLGEVEKQLPKAVAEFKKQYPDGEFDIKIDIHIQSDKKAKNPIDLVPEGDAAPDDGAKKPDAAKPEAKPAPKR